MRLELAVLRKRWRGGSVKEGGQRCSGRGAAGDVHIAFAVLCCAVLCEGAAIYLFQCVALLLFLACSPLLIKVFHSLDLASHLIPSVSTPPYRSVTARTNVALTAHFFFHPLVPPPLLLTSSFHWLLYFLPSFPIYRPTTARSSRQWPRPSAIPAFHLASHQVPNFHPPAPSPPTVQLRSGCQVNG